MRLPQFGLFREDAADDRRGRHGQCAGGGKRPVELDVHQHQDAHNRQHGNDDLQSAQPEHQAAHGFELGQGKFEADAEHQKDDTDFA